MQIKEFDIILDIKDLKNVKYRDPITQKIIKEITVVREDYLGNQFNIYLEDGGQPYIIGDNKVQIIFKKFDNTTVAMSTETNDVSIVDNIAKCILSTNVMALAGRQVQAEVIVCDINGVQITSARFYFRVTKGLLTDEVVQSTNELPLLNKLVQQVTDLDKTLTDNEALRVEEFNGIVNTANTTKDGLDASIIQGCNINRDLSISINDANIINNNLTKTVETGNLEYDKLQPLVEDAIAKNTNLTESIGDATVKKDLLDKSISDSTTKKSELDNSIATGINTKNELDQSIQTGGAVFEDVAMLKELRMYQGITQPTDTPFWYDPTDN